MDAKRRYLPTAAAMVVIMAVAGQAGSTASAETPVPGAEAPHQSARTRTQGIARSLCRTWRMASTWSRAP